MILHFSHIGLTEGRTFMFPFGWLYREEAQAGLSAAAAIVSVSRTHAKAERAPDATNQHSKGGAVRSPDPGVSDDAVRGAPRGSQAAARALDSCQGVRIRGASAVTATVNSKCAASEPSCE
jgi:hypothetical protein